MTASEAGRDPLAGTTPLDPQAARSFCHGLGETVDALIKVLDEETRLVRAARLSEAASLCGEKSAASDRYMKAHGVLRASAPDLARLAPDEVGHLRERQQALESAISANLTVLATARTVSETLIREVAEIVTRRLGTTTTYGADGRQDTQSPKAAPLTCNVAL